MTDTSPPRATGAHFQAFVELIARLRGPDGCPWDREQTHESLKPNMIEEAYEVVEAVDQGDDELAGELGDVLLQVVFHAQMARERQAFTIDEVIARISEKMVRRHPHVFANDPASTPAEVLRNWESLKATERAARHEPAARESMLESVSKALPGVLEAFQMSTKAARVGFDWPDAPSVLAKLDEEVAELRQAASASDPRAVADEIGDLLFVVVNVARVMGVDPESALKAANRKFRRRFGHVEARLREAGRAPAESDAGEMETLWQEAKRQGL
jgi:tetrapyrrole methylase family protein/MazG family protein